MTFIREIRKKSGTYYAEVKSYRKNGKVKQKVIRYLGKKIDGHITKKIYSKDVIAENVKRSLDVMAIHKTAQDLGLLERMKNRCFLALVYSQLLENRSIHKLEEWFRFTEIPEVLGTEITTKKLYDSLTDIENFEKIELEIFNYLKKFEKEKKAAIIDVTDTYFEGNQNEEKQRKGKDGKRRHLIQIGLAVSFRNGFPIFHRTYSGNLSNIQIFKDMSLELQKHRISSIILDRGMLSEENLGVILKLGLGVIAGLKKVKTLVTNYVSQIHRDKIYTAAHRVKLKNTSVFIQSFRYKKGKLIVVYNPALEVLKKELNFEKEKPNNRYVGHSLIYHNTSLSDKEVVKKYYEKDTIERAFKQLKGVLNLRPIRVWLKEHVEGHIKICYLAYAILSLINHRLRKQDISASTALESLKYGYKVTLKNKIDGTRWDTIVPLQPKQQKILKALKCNV